jgi:P-type E1-E2 ATPase
MGDLLTFAKEGLRTLVVAQKIITEAQYSHFDSELHEIKTSASEDKEEQLEALYNSYEQGLNYVGATAIEDKLQYGVPETIATLIKANIKVWVLTGDKQETAIEIGKSCKLIQPDMSLEILTSPTEDEFRDKLLDLIQKYNINLSQKILDLD